MELFLLSTSWLFSILATAFLLFVLDLFDFRPDNAALESILNNVGVVELKTQATPSISTSTLCSPSPFKQVIAHSTVPSIK